MRHSATFASWVLALLAAVATLTGCSLATLPGGDPGPAPEPGPGPSAGPLSVEIVIVEDPVGGRGVSDVACTFEADQLGVDGSTPVTVRVDWSAPCGTHKSETFTFRGGHETYTSTYGDPAGTPLGMTFWATIQWVDARGSHVVRSADAACTY
jgi:hypothetical protein